MIQVYVEPTDPLFEKRRKQCRVLHHIPGEPMPDSPYARTSYHDQDAQVAYDNERLTAELNDEAFRLTVACLHWMDSQGVDFHLTEEASSERPSA